VLSFAYKHWNGTIPEPGDFRPEDRELTEQIEAGFKEVGDSIEAVKIRAALQLAMGLARSVNAYLDSAPWFKVIKEDKSAAATTVFTALQAINNLKILLAPFLPFSSERLHRMLGYEQPLFGKINIEVVKEDARSHDVLVYDGSNATGRWEASTLRPGTAIAPPEPLYKKLDDEIIEEERLRLHQADA
jgi:methionyl-tRNA synthetase